MEKNYDLLKETISKNIIKYRKELGLTQLELADKLNYSDKTLSKWERAEAIPDVITLKQLADLFGITVDALISENTDYIPSKEKKGKSKRTKISVVSLSVGIVWLVACVVCLILALLKDTYPNIRLYLCVIFALPVTSIVLIVYSALWGNKYYLFTTTSCLLWTTALTIHLSLINVINQIGLIYIVCIPLQVMAFIFFIILKRSKK